MTTTRNKAWARLVRMRCEAKWPRRVPVTQVADLVERLPLMDPVTWAEVLTAVAAKAVVVTVVAATLAVVTVVVATVALAMVVVVTAAAVATVAVAADKPGSTTNLNT